MKPCGHAASGDSVDGLRPTTLPPAAWKTLRVSHMPTRPATAIVRGKEKKLTYQLLSVATLRDWRGYDRDGGGVLSETLAGNAPGRVAGMAGIRILLPWNILAIGLRYERIRIKGTRGGHLACDKCVRIKSSGRCLS